MKKFTAFVFAALLCQGVFAGTISGRVVGVSDGDTITVFDGTSQTHKIRLSGIDAPEKAQPFGQRSKASLSGMVYGKTVNVVFDERDRYGRIVGKVMLGSRDVNLEQIRLGMAWHYKRYSNDPAYAEAEEAARRKAAGLWSEPDPTPPWSWRKSGRTAILWMMDRSGYLFADGA